MARAYSNDLRRKLLEAHDRGEGSLRELAGRFGVSGPWAWKISAQRLRTGQTQRVEQRYGRASRGERVPEGTSAGHWHTLTLLGAMTTRGLLASMTVDSPTDGDVFLAY